MGEYFGRTPTEMAAIMADKGSVEAYSLQRIYNDGRYFYMFVPSGYLSKTLLKFFISILILNFASTFSLWGALLLPVNIILLYRYYIFTSRMKQFNFSPGKLWLFVLVWYAVSFVLCSILWYYVL